MTKEEAQREFEEILDWAIAEEDKISEELRAEGKLFGLDTNSERYKPIAEERNRRIRELQKRYEEEKE